MMLKSISLGYNAVADNTGLLFV